MNKTLNPSVSISLTLQNISFSAVSELRQSEQRDLKCQITKARAFKADLQLEINALYYLTS